MAALAAALLRCTNVQSCGAALPGCQETKGRCGVWRILALPVPPIGLAQVMDPYRFWERQKDAANITNPGYSYNSLFGKMILTVTDAGARSVGVGTDRQA